MRLLVRLQKRSGLLGPAGDSACIIRGVTPPARTLAGASGLTGTSDARQDPGRPQAIIDRIAAQRPPLAQRRHAGRAGPARAVLLSRRFRTRSRPAQRCRSRGRRARATRARPHAPAGPSAGARVQPGSGSRRLRVIAYGHHGRHRRHALPRRLARHRLLADRPRGSPAGAPGIRSRSRLARPADRPAAGRHSCRIQARVLAVDRGRSRDGPASYRGTRRADPKHARRCALCHG